MKHRWSRHLILFGLVLMLAVGSSSQHGQPAAVEAAGEEGLPAETSCRNYQLELTASDAIPVPDFCIGGLCKLLLYTNTAMGAFGPGYSWEVYYAQLPSPSKQWYGGPNVSLGGVAFSEGSGINGNDTGEGVFLGGTTQDGGYIRIMDDGAFETSPELWTVESKASRSLTQASLQVCAIPGTIYSGIITSDQSIPVPEFCVDSLCMILRYTDATFGAFGPGLSLPVFYEQDSGDNRWIGGPRISLAGMKFSAGLGINGSAAEDIFDGGIAEGGGHAKLLDDNGETSPEWWSVDFESGDVLDEVFYYFSPMSCKKVTTLNPGLNTIGVPPICVDELCTLVRWTDGLFGAWEPGLSWPVNYQQDSETDAWIGGPALCLGGQCFSDGEGTNGNDIEEMIFSSGVTEKGGTVRLMDDSEAYDNAADFWLVDWEETDDLTEVAYYFCSNTCEETAFMINRQYLPLVDR